VSEKDMADRTSPALKYLLDISSVSASRFFNAFISNFRATAPKEEPSGEIGLWSSAPEAFSGGEAFSV